ncbi:MAG TPA: hypothetical protein VGA37_04580 [Gemmatimonadales bacterium]
MIRSRRAARRAHGVIPLIAAMAACDAPVTSLQPIFLRGRAVAPAGDSLFAVTDAGSNGVVLLDARGRVRDTLGAGIVTTPRKVQLVGSLVYVSDLTAGNAPRVVALDRSDSVRRVVPLDGYGAPPHQYAVLPDGGIVFEVPDARLVVLRDDSIATFAVVEQGTRPSLTTAAGGGVLHAVPGRQITLYNGFGSIRWRIEWPWVETAFVSDIAVDAKSRVHMIVGSSREETFTVQTLALGTGEVIRWSTPGLEADFVVDRIGEVSPAKGRWQLP